MPTRFFCQRCGQWYDQYEPGPLPTCGCGGQVWGKSGAHGLKPISSGSEADPPANPHQT